MNTDYFLSVLIQRFVRYTDEQIEIDMIIAEPKLWIEGEAERYVASLMLQLGDKALVAILAICHVNRSRGSLIFC